MMEKKLYLTFAVLLFIYMMWPGPASIKDFQDLPNSAKSTLSGDTWQIPDVAGYFSDNYRKYTTKYYFQKFQRVSHFPFPPVRINYPPEFAFTAIKKHTDSTYLEEFVYPLRDSIYVNGLEPFYEDGKPKFWGSSQFNQTGKSWYTKVTVRYYKSSILSKFVVWLGIIISIAGIYKMTRKVLV